jgi:hypothetical protein
MQFCKEESRIVGSKRVADFEDGLAPYSVDRQVLSLEYSCMATPTNLFLSLFFFLSLIKVRFLFLFLFFALVF